MRKGYLDKVNISTVYSKEDKKWVVFYHDMSDSYHNTKEEAESVAKRLRDDDRRVREVYRLLYVHLSQHGFIRFYLDIKSKHKDADQIMEMVREDYLN
jgi:hypothetical protein